VAAVLRRAYEAGDNEDVGQEGKPLVECLIAARSNRMLARIRAISTGVSGKDRSLPHALCNICSLLYH
jgi:hypothetical protein